MVGVRVKYYNNYGHFFIEGGEKFQVEGDATSFGLPHSEDRHCKQCICSIKLHTLKNLPDGSTVRSPFEPPFGVVRRNDIGRSRSYSEG